MATTKTFSKNAVVNQIKENYKYIHYIYSLLYPKIYNRTNHFDVQNKSSFEFGFSL